MTYDPVRDRIVSFGGYTPTCSSATWEFDGSSWLPRSPATIPPPRAARYLWFDSSQLRVCAWGGNCQVVSDQNIWTYETASYPSYGAIGTGCTTGNPVSLNEVNGRSPWLGDLFTVALSGEPPGAPAWMATGFSATRWGSTSLPLDLAFVGAPGCMLRVEPFVWYGMTRTPQGRAEWSITIPALNSLIGRSFYNQALALDASANSLGSTFSSAMHGVIGAR